MGGYVHGNINAIYVRSIIEVKYLEIKSVSGSRKLQQYTLIFALLVLFSNVYTYRL